MENKGDILWCDSRGFVLSESEICLIIASPIPSQIFNGKSKWIAQLFPHPRITWEVYPRFCAFKMSTTSVHARSRMDSYMMGIPVVVWGRMNVMNSEWSAMGWNITRTLLIGWEKLWCEWVRRMNTAVHLRKAMCWNTCLGPNIRWDEFNQSQQKQNIQRTDNNAEKIGEFLYNVCFISITRSCS